MFSERFTVQCFTIYILKFLKKYILSNKLVKKIDMIKKKIITILNVFYVFKNMFLMNLLFYKIFIINFAKSLNIRRMYDKETTIFFLIFL